MSEISHIKKDLENKKTAITIDPTKTTVVEGSTRHSVECSFASFILNQFLQNTKKAVNNVFKKFTAEENCMKCSNADDELEKVDYKIQPEKLMLFRTQSAKVRKSDESDFYCNLFLFLFLFLI